MNKLKRLKNIWKGMLYRCTNKKSNRYTHYGARGIKVCEEWTQSFGAFYHWAITNGYGEELSIDRIDNNGDYTPNNCRWVTAKEQNNNTRANHLITYNGKTQTMAQWADEIGVNYPCLEQRINRLNWSLDQALKP